MTAKDLQSAIDAQGIIPAFIAAQDKYATSNGKFAQLLRTHVAAPADGAEVTPDNLTAKPYYQATDGAALVTLAKLPDTLPVCLICDQYHGPQGFGYVLIMEAELDGALWRRQVNTGPEAWRDQDWALMEPATAPDKVAVAEVGVTDAANVGP